MFVYCYAANLRCGGFLFRTVMPVNPCDIITILDFTTSEPKRSFYSLEHPYYYLCTLYMVRNFPELFVSREAVIAINSGRAKKEKLALAINTSEYRRGLSNKIDLLLPYEESMTFYDDPESVIRVNYSRTHGIKESIYEEFFPRLGRQYNA